MLELTLPLFLDAFRLLPAFVVFFTIYLPILLMGCLFLIFLDHIGKNRGRNWCLPRITDNKRRENNLRNFGFVQIHRVGISSRKNKAWRSQGIPIGESSRPFWIDRDPCINGTLQEESDSEGKNAFSRSVWREAVIGWSQTRNTVATVSNFWYRKYWKLPTKRIVAISLSLSLLRAN